MTSPEPKVIDVSRETMAKFCHAGNTINNGAATCWATTWSVQAILMRALARLNTLMFHVKHCRCAFHDVSTSFL